MATPLRKGVFCWIIHEQSMPVPEMHSLCAETSLSNFVVWITAFWNQHFLVAIATLAALAALVFQPLGAAMFTVRDTWWTHPRSHFTRKSCIVC